MTTAPLALPHQRRYRIEEIRAVRGEPPAGLMEGSNLVRSETNSAPPSSTGALLGVTQHLAYTRAPERRELAGISAADSGPMAVLIPISKTQSWWALAQDERDRLFRGRAERPGHLGIGRNYAGRIFRKLYHARYAPGSTWDFLTYFEFPREGAATFRALLQELRDPQLNPEWEYVERETEIWLTQLN
jgi:chlorite dismutase